MVFYLSSGEARDLRVQYKNYELDFGISTINKQNIHLFSCRKQKFGAFSKYRWHTAMRHNNYLIFKDTNKL